MGIFGKGKSGGLMNVIRCNEDNYLVWKWRPEGQPTDSTSRENAIRYGSSLRVREGEVAVFFYRQKNGLLQDFIYGPHDSILKTDNFPVLASIVGMGWGGESPFQAEVYFINMAEVVQVNFAVPYFDVFDPRFLDFSVPVAVGGSITFKITDPQAFIKAHRLINFTLEQLREQIHDAVKRRVKNEVMSAPARDNFPVVQIESRISTLNESIEQALRTDLEDFGVSLRRLDIGRIDIDKSSPSWVELREMTAAQQKATVMAQTQANVENILRTQEINARNMDETLAIQREEMQRAQRLQTETQFIGAHALNRQADVLGKAAESLGSVGGFGEGAGSSGINPAQFMTGMALGGALGGQMAGMVNNMGQQMNTQWQQAAGATQTPPPMPGSQEYFVAQGGTQTGPFSLQQLTAMAAAGQLTPQTLVWTQGMPSWEEAATQPPLAHLFTPAPSSMTPPPMPGATPPPIP